jgi:methylenetetrahydrofolate reductase (NADPH)
MIYQDEPVPGQSLPMREGHSSPGRLERLLRDGQFVVTSELAPPDSADPGAVYERAEIFDGYVDAINATDGSGANCHMSSMAVCALLTQRGYALIQQISCRDKNRIAIQGDILGGAAMGICNMLCLSGDGVQAGDHPLAKPVFDLDCMSLLTIAKTMRDDSTFQSGRKLDYSPKVFLGAAANPFVQPFDWRPQRLAKKVAAGAQFIQTQYCYDIDRLHQYMSRIRDMGLHEKVFMIVGVGPLASARAAEWIRSNVPGVHIPDSVIKRLSGADDQKAEGVNLCIDMIQQIKEIEGVHGVHIMAYRQEHNVPDIVERSNALEGRTTWHPKLYKPINH